MKRLATLFVALLCSFANAAPFDLIISQLDQFGSGSIPRLMALPSGGQPGFLVYDPTSNLPKLFPPASSLCVTSGQVGICSATLNAKFDTPAGTSAQYVRGDGSLATFPSVGQFNYGAPGSRSLALSTSYQATNTAKAADIAVSPSCGASLSLSGGQTCTLQARVDSSAVTCSTGTVVATWTNGNTGTLTVGINTLQTIGAPHTLKLPIGWHFILCPVSGSPSLATVVDQSAG